MQSKKTFGNLIPQFDKASGTAVKIIWDGVQVLANRIAGAEMVTL